jgi:ribosomal protein L40E
LTKYFCDRCGAEGSVKQLTIEDKTEDLPIPKSPWGYQVFSDGVILGQAPPKLFQKQLCKECYHKTLEDIKKLLSNLTW